MRGLALKGTGTERGEAYFKLLVTLTRVGCVLKGGSFWDRIQGGRIGELRVFKL